MTKIINATLVLLASILLASCGSSSKTPEQVYSVGDVISTSEYELQVTDISTGTVVGSEYFNAKASDGGIYVVVSYTLKNISNKPLSAFDLPDPKLVDPSNNKYDPDLEATASYATVAKLDQKVLSDLNPGITTKGAKVFEVAKERFSDDWKVKFDKNVVSLKPKAAPQAAPATEKKAQSTEPMDACFEKALAQFKQENNGEDPSEDSAKWMWNHCAVELDSGGSE